MIFTKNYEGNVNSAELHFESLPIFFCAICHLGGIMGLQLLLMYNDGDMERRREEFKILFVCNHARFASKSRPICFGT